MELAEPSLDTVISAGTSEGVRQYTVVPLFLAAGRHLRKDVPAMIEGLQSQYDVSITLAPPIGENPELGKAIRDVVIQELDSHKQPA
jgi:sirohydrochlorin cobaltochelatase